MLICHKTKKQNQSTIGISLLDDVYQTHAEIIWHMFLFSKTQQFTRVIIKVPNRTQKKEPKGEYFCYGHTLALLRKLEKSELVF